MKKITFGIAISFLIINFCLGQNTESGDFFEVGIKSGQLTKSSLLENTKFNIELSDPNTEEAGFMASHTGKTYAAKVRYGKRIFTNGHLIAELGFSKLNEQIICFCHACDKISTPYTLAKLNAINTGIGARYQLLKIKKINFSIEGIASFSFLTNESGIKYFGYSIHPFIGYQISENLNVNLKFGYEASFNNYQKREKYIEFAINHQIKKKAS